MIENRMRVEREIDRGRIDILGEEKGPAAQVSQGLPLLRPRQAAETAVETDSDQSRKSQAVTPTTKGAPPSKADANAAARRRKQLVNRLGLGNRQHHRFVSPKLPSIGNILSGRDSGHHIESADGMSSDEDMTRGQLSGYSSSEMDH
jgi:hypothetical protein